MDDFEKNMIDRINQQSDLISMLTNELIEKKCTNERFEQIIVEGVSCKNTLDEISLYESKGFLKFIYEEREHDSKWILLRKL